MTGDGIADFAVESHGDDVGNAADAGSALLFNGATWSLIWRMTDTTPAANDRLGLDVAGAVTSTMTARRMSTRAPGSTTRRRAGTRGA